MVTKTYSKDTKDHKLAVHLADIAEKAESMGLEWFIEKRHSGEGDIPYSVFFIGTRKRKWWPFKHFNFTAFIAFEIDWVWRKIQCHDERYIEFAEWIENKLGSTER